VHTQSWDQEVKEREFVFVDFYAPWYGDRVWTKSYTTKLVPVTASLRKNRFKKNWMMEMKNLSIHQ